MPAEHFAKSKLIVGFGVRRFLEAGTAFLMLKECTHDINSIDQVRRCCPFQQAGVVPTAWRAQGDRRAPTPRLLQQAPLGRPGPGRCLQHDTTAAAAAARLLLPTQGPALNGRRLLVRTLRFGTRVPSAAD